MCRIALAEQPAAAVSRAPPSLLRALNMTLRVRPARRWSRTFAERDIF